MAIETCPACGGAVRMIACIEDPVVIQKAVAHLKTKHDAYEPFPLPESWAPPEQDRFQQRLQGCNTSGAFTATADRVAGMQSRLAKTDPIVLDDWAWPR